jgi:hypothetical protein
VAACAVAGAAGHDTSRLSVGLALLGLGWSATMVAGSTLITEAVDVVVRPAVQGLNDIAMGVAGALAGAVSGLVVAVGGYSTLALLSALAVLPLLALALRPVRAEPAPAGAGGVAGPGVGSAGGSGAGSAAGSEGGVSAVGFGSAGPVAAGNGSGLAGGTGKPGNGSGPAGEAAPGPVPDADGTEQEMPEEPAERR